MGVDEAFSSLVAQLEEELERILAEAADAQGCSIQRGPLRGLTQRMWLQRRSKGRWSPA